MTVAWVVGSGGLLGSALYNAVRRTETRLFTPVERFCWDNESNLNNQLYRAVKEFAALVKVEEEWQIYWAAGVGTMSSTEAVLESAVDIA